jgi:hypothetical protein
MGWLIRKLRDLDAFLTAYGQCLRCHRSWKRASPVSVWHSPSSATFILCAECWADIVGEPDPHAGLILQGYADEYLKKHPRDPVIVGDILAAYGMAWRCGVEWRPQWRRPLMFDVHPMLGERRRSASQGMAAGLDIDQLQQDGAQEPWPVDMTDGEMARWTGVRPPYDEEPDDEPDPPGWNGAGSDTPNGDMEVGRG